jgi:hypothetical protein
MLFNVLYDVVWFVIVYVLSYLTVDYVSREYAQAVKVLFDVNVRGNLDLSLDDRHNVLFVFSSGLSFIILTINPVFHSILYIIFMFMIDFVDLNRILLYLLLFKLSKNINPYVRRIPDVDPIVVTQVLFIILNYHNTSFLIPVLFQLIDESTNIMFYYKDLLRAHGALFSSDTWLKDKITSLIVLYEKRRVTITNVKVGVLSIIVLLDFLCSQLATWSDVGFYYYAVAKIGHMYRVRQY